MLISTGGGVVETPEAVVKLCDDKNNIVVFINPAFDILVERTSRNDKRPLLRGNVAEKLKLLLDRRLPLYEKYCNVNITIEKEQHVKETAIQCVDGIVEYAQKLY